MPNSLDREQPGYTRGGRPRADRAQQFMPFAALAGYYQMIREMQRVVEERHELTDEEAAELAISRNAVVNTWIADRLRTMRRRENAHA